MRMRSCLRIVVAGNTDADFEGARDVIWGGIEQFDYFTFTDRRRHKLPK